MTFEEYLKLKGLRDSTITAKLEILARLQKNTDMTPTGVQKYLEIKRLAGVSAGHLNKNIKILLEFWSYQNRKVALAYFPTSGYIKTTSMFTTDELNKFFAVKRCNGQSELHYVRFKTFFYALATTGARPSEIASLSLTGNNRLDLGADMIFLQDTKTTPREIPIPKSLHDMFTSYINIANITDSMFRFRSRNVWEQSFNRWLGRAGIIKRKGLTVYSFRRTFITDTLQNDAVLFDVQSVVGHRSSETTQEYYFPNRRSKLKAIKKHTLLCNDTSIDDLYNQLVEWLAGYASSDLRHEITKNGSSIVLKISRPIQRDRVRSRPKDNPV